MEISMNNFSGWSELLCDLAHEIQERLALDDLIRFSSVCSFWNSLSGSFLRHKGRLPWLIVPYYVDPNVGRDPNYCSDGILGFFSILDGLTYKLEIPELVGRRICGTAFGWFITVHGNSEMQLLHPFTRKVVQLPALTEFPYSVGTRFSEEEGFLYQLQESLDDTENISEVNSDYMRDFHIYKAVTSPGLTNSSQPTVVIAIPMVYRQLYFCRPGKDSKWKRVIGKTAYYSDVTLYKGDFYAVRHTGEVDVVKNLDDADGSSVPTTSFVISATKDYDVNAENNYLVESSNELLLVIRIFPDFEGKSYRFTQKFVIIKLDFSGPNWVEVKDLGDCALFVGFNNSLSVVASDFPGCKRNCIYFSDDDFDSFFTGHDKGIFYLDTCTIEKICPIYSKFVSPRPLWYSINP